MLIATYRTNYRDVTGRNNSRCSVRTLSPTGESGALGVIYGDWSRLRLVALGFTLDHSACVVARRLQPKPVPVDRTLILGDGSCSPGLASARLALKHLYYLNQLILYTYASVSRVVGAPRPGKRLAHLPITQVVGRTRMVRQTPKVAHRLEVALSTERESGASEKALLLNAPYSSLTGVARSTASA